jgi:hypothetical protein
MGRLLCRIVKGAGGRACPLSPAGDVEVLYLSLSVVVK